MAEATMTVEGMRLVRPTTLGQASRMARKWELLAMEWSGEPEEQSLWRVARAIRQVGEQIALAGVAARNARRGR